MLNAIMLSVVMLNAVMLNAVMLNVVAPSNDLVRAMLWQCTFALFVCIYHDLYISMFPT